MRSYDLDAGLASRASGEADYGDSNFLRNAPAQGLANPLNDRFSLGSALNHEAMGVNHAEQLEAQAKLQGNAAGGDGMYDRMSLGNRRSFADASGGLDFENDEFANRFGSESDDNDGDAQQDMLEQVFRADPSARPGEAGLGQGPSHRKSMVGAGAWSGPSNSSRASSVASPPPAKRRWYQKLWSAVRGKGWR